MVSNARHTFLKLYLIACREVVSLFGGEKVPHDIEEAKTAVRVKKDVFGLPRSGANHQPWNTTTTTNRLCFFHQARGDAFSPPFRNDCQADNFYRVSFFHKLSYADDQIPITGH